jgi:hypothetical protein
MEFKDCVDIFGTLISVIGLIISLVYVAKQIGENTKAIRSTAYQNATEHITNITFAISSDKEFAEFVQRVGLNEENSENKNDILRWEAYAYSIFRNFDNIFYQCDIGTIDKERMNDLIHMAIEFNLQVYPQMREYWKRTQYGFNEKFRNYVNDIYAKVKLQIH